MGINISLRFGIFLIFLHNGHSQFQLLFSGMWTRLLEQENIVKRRCKERGWNYKTYKHGI